MRETVTTALNIVYPNDEFKELKKNLEYNDAEKILDELPFVARTISHDDLENESIEVVSALFPNWNKSMMKVSRCTDGITNKLLKVTNMETCEIVLVRCYGNGTSIIIDRHNELISIITLSLLNFAPPVYGRFENGFCYGFTHGRVLQPKDIREPNIGFLIAKKLAKWHRIEFPSKHVAQPMLWTTMRRWLSQVPTVKETELQKNVLLNELDELETLVNKNCKTPVVFCHNDLLAPNIIMNEDNLNDPICFIDYEYSSFSFAAYEIANHFNEYAGFECDYSQFPSIQHRRMWLKAYLTEFLSRSPTDGEVETWLDDVQMFSRVNHLFWGIWSLVQSSVSDIDFDYLNYAKLRISEYNKLKV